eukprot:2333221-Pleurochrysis_carterae.AAC.1
MHAWVNERVEGYACGAPLVNALADRIAVAAVALSIHENPVRQNETALHPSFVRKQRRYIL